MPDKERLVKADQDYLLHPSFSFAEHKTKGPRIIVEAEGVYITDIDGKKYLEGIGGLWLANIGYSREEMAQAVYDQTKALSYFPLFWGNSNLPAIELAEKLAQMTPEGLNKVFFTSGGSESNDTSFKMARLYFALQGQPEKNKIVARKLSYHGLTYGALSATYVGKFWQGYDPLAPGFIHIDPPYCYRCPWGKEYGKCNIECALALEEVIQREEETVAAFIAEPVFGVGGVIIPPDEYFPKIREICDKYGVLYISDEVIAGFGRTGKNFGFEHWDVKPDFISCAKGISSGYIQLGASIMDDRIYEVISSNSASLSHGFTYTGHPVACAVGLKNLEIIERENLMERAREMGDYLYEQLKEKMTHKTVGQIRHLGLIAGVEFVQDKVSKAPIPPELKAGARIQAECAERGLIVRSLSSPGVDVISLSPPFIITREQIDFIVDTLSEAVTAVEKTL